ncbi:hypothetical protein CGCVW01_v012380 [Colletotrichum viniferum]|nr:hypothetical protein CGCVW01_v012380 [Colletotrichum viniferum]
MGFLVTGWLVVILAILRYCLAFDPTIDPLANPNRDRQYGTGHVWKPNVIDVKTTSMFSGLRRRLGHHSYWDMALTKILLTMCDVQLLTGLGLLFAGFVSLDCYVSAYHWQILSYLAWFSNLTHAACLTALRQHMYYNQMERNFRMILMFILLAGLIAAIVPTGYFNWDESVAHSEGTASKATSNARCFFSHTTIQALWNEPWYTSEKGSPWATTAYESSVLSIILLTFSFFSRSVKMFRTLSELAKDTIRHRVGLWAASRLTATATGCRRFGSTPIRRKLLEVFRPLDVMIGLYLVVKLYLDVLTSEMADVSTT